MKKKKVKIGEFTCNIERCEFYYPKLDRHQFCNNTVQICMMMRQIKLFTFHLNLIINLKIYY